MEVTTDSVLDLLKLRTLFNTGMSSIPVDKKYQSAVLVIGDTGVGKSTILSFLAGRKLSVRTQGVNTVFDCDEKDGLKIGHDKFS
jgi:ABC-type phosphate/phosphonate transport system ATPase subunit